MLDGKWSSDHGGQHLPAPYKILEMNVIRHCWEVLRAQGNSQVALFCTAFPNSDRQAWDQAFSVCQHLEAVVQLPPVEQAAHLKTKRPGVIQPATEEVLWAYVPRGSLQEGQQVLVDDYRGGQQECCVGWTVACVKAHNIPLHACNLHAYPIELTPQRPLVRVAWMDPDSVQSPPELVIRPSQRGLVAVGV